MTHLTTTFGETPDNLCLLCNSKTLLICAGHSWSVAETDEPIEDAPEYVEIKAEVTGHYCDKCGMMTSLSFNQRRDA